MQESSSDFGVSFVFCGVDGFFCAFEYSACCVYLIIYTFFGVFGVISIYIVITTYMLIVLMVICVFSIYTIFMVVRVIATYMLMVLMVMLCYLRPKILKYGEYFVFDSCS